MNLLVLFKACCIDTWPYYLSQKAMSAAFKTQFLDVIKSQGVHPASKSIDAFSEDRNPLIKLYTKVAAE